MGSKIELGRPAGSMVAVTKSNSVDIADGPSRALLVGTAGTANIVMADGTTLSNVPLQQGYNPLRVQRVNTGGTASDIWALL